MPVKEYITVIKAAEMLGIHPETLRYWDRSGKLKTRRHPINKFRVYTLEDIEQIKKKISNIQNNRWSRGGFNGKNH